MLTRRSIIVGGGLTLALSSVMSGQEEIAGTWKGTLPKADLPLVFKFGANGSGSVDSTKQSFHTAARIKLSGSDVTISVPAVQGTFTGTLDDNKMTGTWVQGSGYSDDLVLVKE
ncbi:MAG TPA: hypothetical protein VG675_19565 [Bryobacteraceae bacterium]|nr:hypothetical protein [Bryobacteraceae bacterium]